MLGVWVLGVWVLGMWVLGVWVLGVWVGKHSIFQETRKWPVWLEVSMQRGQGRSRELVRGEA